MALNDSSVSDGLFETSSEVAVISFDETLAVISFNLVETAHLLGTEVTILLTPSVDETIRMLAWLTTTKPKTDRATLKTKKCLSCIKGTTVVDFSMRNGNLSEAVNLFTMDVSRQLWPSGWTVASFVLDAAATLWTQTSDGRQVLPILSTVSAGRIAALDVHRVDITADATLRAF